MAIYLILSFKFVLFAIVLNLDSLRRDMLDNIIFLVWSDSESEKHTKEEEIRRFLNGYLKNKAEELGFTASDLSKKTVFY